jgi:hypothetical protein
MNCVKSISGITKCNSSSFAITNTTPTDVPTASCELLIPTGNIYGRTFRLGTGVSVDTPNGRII